MRNNGPQHEILPRVSNLDGIRFIQYSNDVGFIPGRWRHILKQGIRDFLNVLLCIEYFEIVIYN